MHETALKQAMKTLTKHVAVCLGFMVKTPALTVWLFRAAFDASRLEREICLRCSEPSPEQLGGARAGDSPELLRARSSRRSPSAVKWRRCYFRHIFFQSTLFSDCT